MHKLWCTEVQQIEHQFKCRQQSAVINNMIILLRSVWYRKWISIQFSINMPCKKQKWPLAEHFVLLWWTSIGLYVVQYLMCTSHGNSSIPEIITFYCSWVMRLKWPVAKKIKLLGLLVMVTLLGTGKKKKRKKKTVTESQLR